MSYPTYPYEQIESLIPHSGDMCLWEAVLKFDDHSIQCRTSRHLAPDHPLKNQGRLSHLSLIEYGAQAVALHGGLLNHKNQGTGHSQTGYLASARNVSFPDLERFNQATPLLFAQAEQLMADETSKLYEFQVFDAQMHTLCSGRVTIIHPEGLKP